MPRILQTVCIVVAVAAGVLPAGAQTSGFMPQRPLETRLPWSPGEGAFEIASGVSFRHDVSAPFTDGRRAFRRDMWRADVVDISAGTGRLGEVRLRFGLQRFSEDSGLDKTGIQDAVLDYSWQIPGGRRLAAAVGFGVKLPNAPEQDRLGTDSADVFLTGSAGGRGERWGWAANAGLGILGHPARAGVQDDVLILGAAAWWRPPVSRGRLSLFAEVSGQAQSRFGNDFREARAGTILEARKVRIDMYLIHGLTSESASWGGAAGITFLLESDHPHTTR